LKYCETLTAHLNTKANAKKDKKTDLIISGTKLTTNPLNFKSKFLDYDYLCSVNFYTFYIMWQSKKYEESVHYLNLAQHYITRIMEEELPTQNIVFDQVNEVDEETDRDPSPQRPPNQPQNANRSRNDATIKVIGASYYDSSDSESAKNGKNNSGDGTEEKKKSRLSQLSKFNLFALIELANACLVIKLHKNINQSLHILNEAIMTLKILAERAGTIIVAQELLELLVSQIIDYKTEELDLYDVEQASSPQKNTDDKKPSPAIPSNQIMAISAIDPESITLNTSKVTNIDSDSPDVVKHCKINTRGIMNSIHTILTITTLVPFIKSGIPRISDYDVKEAKLQEKEHRKKRRFQLWSTKPFMEAITLRDNILSTLDEPENDLILQEEVGNEKINNDV